MHVAEKGEGPVILFLHGFPELWYSCRHQITALSQLGYRAVWLPTNLPNRVKALVNLSVAFDSVAMNSTNKKPIEGFESLLWPRLLHV
ncbi:Epoxide hydrolase 2 [Melia azedarach]|uniref:Epoxide hydrolase 2 n=1 Tax=Melia azedarach TaxID=155640 RepID=A0ACC1X537_MELAZ|nr:Epoxide hydrolase 2 [Melia azedarach]